MPTAEDLDDPQGFSQRRQLAESSDSEVDAALQRLLDGGFDETPEADGVDPTDKQETNDDDSSESGKA